MKFLFAVAGAIFGYALVRKYLENGAEADRKGVAA